MSRTMSTASAKGRASCLRMFARSTIRGPLAPTPGREPVVRHVPGRGDEAEARVGLGLLDVEFAQRGLVAREDVGLVVLHVEGAEHALGASSSRRSGEHDVELGVLGAEAVGRPAADHVGAQAQGRDAEPVLGLEVGHGVIVVGLGGARDVGVVPAAAPGADELLDDHAHPLLLEGVAGHLEVGPRLLREEARVDELDRLASWRRADAPVGMRVGDDVGLVDAREGHLEHVLEEARGADGEGTVGAGGESPEPLLEPVREPGAEEARAQLRAFASPSASPSRGDAATRRRRRTTGRWTRGRARTRLCR